MTAHSPDFDTILAHGASHRYAGGESAVIRVVTGATLTLTSGHVMFDYPLNPLQGYMCPLQRGVLPETPPVPPGQYPVHLIVADITDAGGGPDVISKVAAVRLVVRDETTVAWDIHKDYHGPIESADGTPDLENVVGLTDCQMCGTFDIRELGEIFSWIHGAESKTAGNGSNSADSGLLTDKGLPSCPIEDAMVMFPAGWGYGDYRTWAGRGADGGLVCLLTDFEVLSESVGPDPRRYLKSASPLSGPASYAAGSLMLVGQTLRRQSLTSPSGSSTLVHQNDGNLVLYRYDLDRAVWASNTNGTSAGELVLQADGNLVLYDRDRRAVWATGTDGRLAARLSVRDEGTVVLEAVDGSRLWSAPMDIRAGKAGHLLSSGTEMVEPYGGGTGFRFKIRNVQIDGQGDTVHVRGGGSHELSFDVLHDCRECGTAINQVIVGLAGQDRAQASVWNGMQRSGGGLKRVNPAMEDNPGPAEWVNVSCNIAVPDQPGSYSVRARYAQAYHGQLMTAEGRAILQPEYQDPLGWWKIDRPDGPGPESAIGTIIVEPTYPYPTGPAGHLSGAPVAVYDTEVRVAERWAGAPQLMVRLDRGEPFELMELAWRSDGGAEATIVFEDGMRAFRGHRRAIDGSLQEYRGTEGGRRSGPGETRDLRVRTFVTEEVRENGRVISGELRLVLDDGGAPVERVTWRDRRGTFISVALRTAPAVRSTVPVAVDEVVASDEYEEAGEVAGHLLGPGPDKWLARESTATLDFVLSEPAVVTAYRLTAGNDYRDRDPRDWRLRGSMDGKTWFTLDSRVGQSFPERSQEREYAVVNSTAYPRYRLDIGRNWGGLPETQLNRVQLLTTDETGLIGTAVPVSRVVASHEYGAAGEVAGNVLRSDGGKWLAWPRPAWLEFHLPRPAAVTAYALTSANDHCARDPKDWLLQGSLDGDTWVTLDRRAGETFSERFLVREFTVANATPYPRYRLYVTDNEGDVREVQLTRVQLLVKNDDRFPALGEFFGILRRADGPAVGYRGKGVVEMTEPREPGREAAAVVPSAAELGGVPAPTRSPFAMPTAEPTEPLSALEGYDGINLLTVRTDFKDHRPSVVPMNPELLGRLQLFRREALKRGIPSEDVERWIATARPSGRLYSGGDGPVVGRFGGPLMLPADIPDPSYPLLATLDCAALPEEVTGLPLPPDGRLLLFGFPDMESVSGSVGEVVYIPAGMPVEERKTKYACFYDEEGNVFEPDYLRVYEQFPQNELRLSADVTLPFHFTINDPEQPFADSLPGHPRSGELVEAWDTVYTNKGYDLRMGGYAYHECTDTDPVVDAAQHVAWMAASSNGPGGAAELPAPEDWVLLAQWDIGLRGREGATMHWVIPRQDLAERRFDRTHVSLFWNP